MNTDIPDWPEIPRSVFDSFIASCPWDYRREGWVNAIEYRRKLDGELFACLLNDGRVLIHPDIHAPKGDGA